MSPMTPVIPATVSGEVMVAGLAESIGNGVAITGDFAIALPSAP